MSDHDVHLGHGDRYRDIIDQVESEAAASAATDGTGTPVPEYVPTSLSGGLNPTTPPNTDPSSVLVSEDMRVEHRQYDGRVEIVHGTRLHDRGDRDRRSDGQSNLRRDRDAGIMGPEAFGGDPIGRSMIE